MPHPAVRPVARPAVLGASRTPTPGNRGTKIAGSGSVDT